MHYGTKSELAASRTVTATAGFAGAVLVQRFGSGAMARHQSPAQKKTVERVMHEFKHGELKTAGGKRKVKNPKQAIAIALHEAGASKYESPKENSRNLRRTKEKERRGETAKDAAEGKGRRKTSAARTSTRKSSSTKSSSTKRTRTAAA